MRGRNVTQTASARRDVGANVPTGCRGGDTVNLAVCDPGGYVLTVRFAEGKARTWPVDAQGGRHVVLEARRAEDAAAPKP